MGNAHVHEVVDQVADAHINLWNAFALMRAGFMIVHSDCASYLVCTIIVQNVLDDLRYFPRRLKTLIKRKQSHAAALQPSNAHLFMPTVTEPTYDRHGEGHCRDSAATLPLDVRQRALIFLAAPTILPQLRGGGLGRLEGQF